MSSFGTLLENALDARQRGQFGAHFTPRAFVERLVMPTVMEPLRAEWDGVKAAAVALAENGDRPGAAPSARSPPASPGLGARGTRGCRPATRRGWMN